MDAPTTYAEIYLHEDGKKLLHRRIYDEQARAQVLREMQGKSFDVLLICNRCIVGAGTYAYTDSGMLIKEEYGACVGFLDHPVTLPNSWFSRRLADSKKRLVPNESEICLAN